MNPETITLITRHYQDVVEDILMAIVGGVTNEPIIYDVKSDLYPLAKPAADIRGISGVVNGNHFTFRKKADFLFSEGDNGVAWVTAGVRPDNETTFYVDYFLQNSRPPLTDLNVGSVTRSLSEAFSREIAIAYDQLNEAYKSGFIDSASGNSLDYVAVFLGKTRKTKEYARGLVTLFRASASTGTITIPEGTILLANNGEVSFETTELRTLQPGQASIDIPVLAVDGLKGLVGCVDTGKIDGLLTPIEGIDRVINFEATFLGAEDETDPEMHSLGKATLMALFRVIMEDRSSGGGLGPQQSGK